MVVEEIYKTAIIYKIFNKWTDEIYIGSTSKSLDERFASHKWSYFESIDECSKYKKKWTASHYLLHKFEDDCDIETIEECYNISKEDLLNLEGFYQMLHRDVIVNNRIATGLPYVYSIII
jgi:hypothetical protein